mgnify:CR=1 FL=1
MSKVKIQGNASGTGVVTLTAPNTNTDRTITLPDETVSLTGAPAGLDDVGGVARATSGLLFNGDTAAANALDDYEEGTFTITVATGTVSSTTADYTKIGNQVTVKFQLNAFSDVTTAANIVMSGFPFTSSTAQVMGSIGGRYVDVSPEALYINGANANMYRTTTGGFTSVTHANLTNTSAALYFEGTYKTA